MSVFLEPRYYICIGNCEWVAEVVSAVVSGDCTRLLSEQSNVYHTQTAQLLEVSPDWTLVIQGTTVLGSLILTGHIQIDNIRCILGRSVPDGTLIFWMAMFIAFFVYKTVNKNEAVKYKIFCMRQGMSVSQKKYRIESMSDGSEPPVMQPAPIMPK